MIETHTSSPDTDWLIEVPLGTHHVSLPADTFSSPEEITPEALAEHVDKYVECRPDLDGFQVLDGPLVESHVWPAGQRPPWAVLAHPLSPAEFLYRADTDRRIVGRVPVAPDEMLGRTREAFIDDLTALLVDPSVPLDDITYTAVDVTVRAVDAD